LEPHTTLTATVSTNDTNAASTNGSTGQSEAVIMTSVLAGWENPQSCADMSLDRANRIVRSTVAEHTNDEVLRWHTRVASPGMDEPLALRGGGCADRRSMAGIVALGVAVMASGLAVR
jgi:hypothetical protein